MNKLFTLVLILLCTMTLSAQERPRLGILPFAGGVGGDGEAIATLFSLQPDIQRAFTVVPRTGAVNALVAEHEFQMAGLTDSDTIAGIGHMLNADYVLSGHIRRLGGRNLVIATIISVETFEQIAGDYQTYQTIEEVRGLLPAMAGRMIAAMGRDTSGLPSLAIAPFRIAGAGVNTHDAETLAQILAVEISNSGRFAVLPRTSTMQAALREFEFQMAGHTAEEGASAMGRAINADHVLSAEAHRLGGDTMFTAQILNVRDGSLHVGSYRMYRAIEDGMRLMGELAVLLTDPEGARTRIAGLDRQRIRQDRFEDPARFWSLGASVGTTFADPWLIGTLRGTVSPMRHAFVELGIDAGFISGAEGVELMDYYSLYPFINLALFMPFRAGGGWYVGAGGGFMIAEYRVDDYTRSIRIPAANFTAGINIRNWLDISYTLRTDFSSVNHKIAVGVSYRFR